MHIEKNNKAIMKAFCFDLKMTEKECVAKLLNLYDHTLKK